MTDELRTWRLPAFAPSFAELVASARFEDVGKGRRGAVLVSVDAQGRVPIVRTTTSYRAPAQRFGELHARLAREIRHVAGLSHELDNALIEHYTSAYSTMKRHSDQAQDLAEGSSIALYSCYRDPARPTRRLVVRSKESDAAFELPLAHGSVVTFSLDTNRRFAHAILLAPQAPPDNEWLGITFRTSRTLVRFADGQPYLPSGARLTLADEDQRRELLRLRRRENEETSFAYPPLTYTLSESDLVPPV